MTDAPRYLKGWPEEWPRTPENLAAVESAYQELRGGIQQTVSDLPQHWHTKTAFRDLLTPEVRRHLKSLSVQEQWKRIDALFLVADQLRAANRSVNTKRQADKLAQMQAIAPVLRAIALADPRKNTKERLGDALAEVLEGILAGDIVLSVDDRRVRTAAENLLATGVMVRPPKGYLGQRFRNWFDRMSVDEMLNFDRI